MIFLLDENIAPSLVTIIAKLGYKCFHARDVKLLSTPDETIFNFAIDNDYILITHVLDFSRIHALSGKQKPSVILFRVEPLTIEFMKNVLTENLKSIESDLLNGAFVVVEEDQIRIRSLPIKSS